MPDERERNDVEDIGRPADEELIGTDDSEFDEADDLDDEDEAEDEEA